MDPCTARDHIWTASWTVSRVIYFSGFVLDHKAMDLDGQSSGLVPREFLAVLLAGFGNESVLWLV